MWRVVVALVLMILTGCSDEAPVNADQGKECAATMHIFLNSNVAEQRERRIGQLIDEAPGVIDSVFHTREEAYREFKQQYRKQPEIYKAKKPSDFPARFEVTLESGQAVGDFERALMGTTTGIDRLVPGGCAPEDS